MRPDDPAVREILRRSMVARLTTVGGFRPNARQIREMLDWDIPVAAAMPRSTSACPDLGCPPGP